MAPIHAAAMKDDPELLEILIQSGADIMSRGHELALYDDSTLKSPRILEGDTPLHCAARFLRYKNLNILLENGAELDAINRLGNTALHMAAQSNFCDDTAIATLSTLIEAGANVLCKTNYSYTPLQIVSLGHEFRRHFCTDAFSYEGMVLLMAAGDRNWECVPTPCPGLEQALLPVWRDAPEDLPELYGRLTNVMKYRIQMCLRVLHGRLPEELRMQVVAAAIEIS